MKSKKPEIEWKKLLYPIFTLVLAFIVAVSFFTATAFFTKNFNKALDAEVPGIDESTNIDLDQLELVAKKLHVSIQKPINPVVESAQTTVLDIEILNGSGTKGAAKTLQTALEKQGYKVTKIGDAPITNKTLIKSKYAVTADYLKLRETLITFLEKKYAFSEEILPEGASSDIIIILGQEF